MFIRFKVGLIITLLALPSMISAQKVTLDQIIKEVCTNSDSVKSMKESLRKSKQVIREQYAAALPDVSMSLFGGRTFGRGMGEMGGGMSIPSSDSMGNPATIGDIYKALGALGSAMSGLEKNAPTGSYSTSIKLEQPIFTFGKIGTAVKVATYYDSSTVYGYKRSLQNLQLAALDAYYRVMVLQMSLDIAERSEGRKKELSEFLTRNFQLGSGSKSQILATNADLASLWPVVIKARQELKTAYQRLYVMMGRPINDSLTIDTTFTLNALMSAPLPSKDSAIISAYRNRQDLHSIDQLKNANLGGAKIFKAMYYPSIAGQASFGFGGRDPEDLVDWDKRTWTVGVAMIWNMFDGFANSAKSQQYLSDSRKLEIGKQTISKMMEIEVEEALSECSAADSNMVAANIVLESNKEAFNLTNENFKQGSGQFAELQLADERLLQGELGIINARYRLVRSRAALQVSMGNSIISLEDK